MKELTLVIPAKNEAECLPIVLNELKNFDFYYFLFLRTNHLYPYHIKKFH